MKRKMDDSASSTSASSASTAIAASDVSSTTFPHIDKRSRPVSPSASAGGPSATTNGTISNNSSTASSHSTAAAAVMGVEVDRDVRGVTRQIVQIYTSPQEMERAQVLLSRPAAIQSLFIIPSSSPPSP